MRVGAECENCGREIEAGCELCGRPFDGAAWCNTEVHACRKCYLIMRFKQAVGALPS